MKTEFNPLEALADISEDELNEFIELQEEAPKKRRRQKTRESFVCFISFYESIKLMPERLHLRAFRVLMDYAFYQKEPPTKTPTRIMQSFVSWRSNNRTGNIQETGSKSIHNTLNNKIISKTIG